MYGYLRSGYYQNKKKVNFHLVSLMELDNDYFVCVVNKNNKIIADSKCKK